MVRSSLEGRRMSGVGIYAWQRGCLESKKNQLVAVQLMAAGKHFHMRLKFPTVYGDGKVAFVNGYGEVAYCRRTDVGIAWLV